MSSGRDVMLEEQQEKAKVKNPPWRPSAYKPEFCQKVIELGKLGKSKAQIAGTIEVTRQTLDNWASEHPDFFNALTMANELSLMWWENQAQHYMVEDKEGPKLNSNLWSRSMAARFPKDYRQEVKQEITGADGAPLLSGLTVNFVKSDDQDESAGN